jgi:import inner membrane translocase subunit TIM9
MSAPQGMQRFLESGSEEEKTAFLAVLNEMQLEDSQRLYNGLSERCFTKCVTDFKARELVSKEKTCITSCATKYLNVMQRCGIRFNEENQNLQMQGNQQK